VAVNRQEVEYLALAAKDLTITSAEIASFPLARIEANKPMPLKEGLNPAWAEAVAKFQADVVKPMLGEKSALPEGDWATIIGRFADYHTWLGSKAGAAVEKLGLQRVREILAGNGQEAITALVAKDKALEPEANAIAALDKLVRYHRDLFKLLNNFVSFRDFYRRKDKAMFQVGTLFLDQRSCELCVRVDDAAKHAALAGLSKTYLAYCELTRKCTGEKMTVAAAFTNGDSDNLMVGRNGIFYDRQGRDWDATITRIVDQPISVRQAFWAPYKKVVRFIEEQIAKRAAAADAASTEKLTAAAFASEKAAVTGKTPDQRPKLDSGVIAALGVAAAGIGGMIGGVVGSFLGLGMWMPLGVLGVLPAHFRPVHGAGGLKLRQRNLGPILDANGWAVNARARINIPSARLSPTCPNCRRARNANSLIRLPRKRVRGNCGCFCSPWWESPSGGGRVSWTICTQPAPQHYGARHERASLQTTGAGSEPGRHQRPGRYFNRRNRLGRVFA